MLLSFDVTAVDVVLMIAVLVLLALFISQRRSQEKAESQLPNQGEKSPENPVAIDQAPVEERSARRHSTGFQKCIHDFGHLRNLPQNTPVPDECFGCPNVMRCLFPNE